ncbi:Nucleolar protein 9 [Purpureocillium takamizusanense]|uniref:Nucleolar protein 9 n=1 Tax=Purpureocillium takamizusanense TaxID=2060973 RepID=A0A9Q8QDK0_9HYPO|nr:Nucleolar protein 9 [Purpureocillium takamizusanense]UNI17695.1 Nucleolar protein 9 [Purpureocillium takamizusanense]
MPKPRTKRSAVREERKRKRQDQDDSNYETKRPRRSEDDAADDETAGYAIDGAGPGEAQHDGILEKEFFGMLADEEQEYFRRADEMLELNQFPTADDRGLFLESVYTEAKGKELKLASSQSCSRLMERLIQLSTTAQKKSLFEAFGGHFLSLVRHRFASHCCEALFLRSAGVVTQELAGYVVDTKRKGADQQEPEASMESLFLATLDELEGSLSFLITDRFASHTLRVLLLVLSGRPLDDVSAKTLMKSKKKENISVAGSAAADEQNQGLRAVPVSFNMAIRKIVSDSTAGTDATGLRVLAKHPIGNPTLQLLLELDLSLSKSEQKSDDQHVSLLQQLLPGAPKSLADGSSEASEFINGMIYDQIGSRLIETLVVQSPGIIFKALNHSIFLPRIQGYVRNDIASYPAIKFLGRLGRDDLVTAVEQILPTVPQLVSKSRFNVLNTLFERCAARGVNDEVKKLMKGLKEGCGSQPVDLVTSLCCLRDEKEKIKDVEQLTRNQYAIQSHGAKLLTTLLSIPGPSKGVHESLLALPPEHLIRLATTSMPTVTLLTTALSTPAANSLFQKSLVSALTPHTSDLATSQFGHNLINAIAGVPSKGKDLSVPYHLKEAVMNQLGAHEAELRESWMGRSVWRSWKGDMWKTRRGDWKGWIKGADLPQQAQQPVAATRGLHRIHTSRKDVAEDDEQVEMTELQDEAPSAMEVDAPEDMAPTQDETEEQKPRKEKKERKEKRDKKDKTEKANKEKKDKRGNKDKEGKEKKAKKSEK